MDAPLHPGEGVEEVVHEGRRLALVLRADFSMPGFGIRFLTPDDAILQLGYMRRPGGHEIQPHMHKPFERTTQGTQEVLFVKEGRVEGDFYARDRAHVATRELRTGDWLFLFGEGHGFRMLEPTVMIEVKNGPYAGDQDKDRFTRGEASP